MSQPQAIVPAPTLDDPKVRTVLDELHRAASGQKLAIARALVPGFVESLFGRKATPAEEAERMKHLYIPVSPSQGTFLYSVARSIGARRVVEFGTSFGISTIYLAAAVRDNGGGLVIGSELAPSKVARARANLERVGLSDLVEIREGDAQETLQDPGGTVDLALLDGWKDLYLPVLKLLTPHFRVGSVVVADNIYLFRNSLRPYVQYMQDPANGFRSVTLFLSDGMEYSVRVA